MAAYANTFYNIIDQTLVRLGTSTTVSNSAYTDAIMNNWAESAHRWASEYHLWPFVERPDSTQTWSSATEIYAYPSDFKTDTITFLQLGGKRHQKLNFEDYLTYREDFSTGQERVWADFGRNYYVNPNTDSSGTIQVWGIYTPAAWDFTDNTAKTVFSDADVSGNEAMVLEMLSYAKTREGKLSRGRQSIGEGQSFHQQAEEILEKIWKRVEAKQFARLTKNRGMFKRFDVLKGALREDLIKRDQFF